MLPDRALRERIDLAGIPAAPEDVAITGDDPVLPTRYRVGAAAAAALAAAGLAAAELWALRTGRRQRVAVDLRAAAVSLRSNIYLRINGEKPPTPWDPLSGFYRTADDSWIYLHCNFPNHRDAALRVLGGAGEKDSVEARARSSSSAALEEAIHAAGGCAGMVRSAEQWAAHPHAAAVADLPLIEITRIGDAPPVPLPPGDRPLSRVRVLDLTRVLAGPTCARTLAEHGADVLKITAPHLPHSGAIELDTGLGKLSAHLDLRYPEAIDCLRRLVCEADVFSQSYRPEALDRRGFGPTVLAALRPGIIYVTLSAWGHAGPWRHRRGFDSVVQAVSGMATLSGVDGAPALLPCSAIDYVSGYLMAFGTMVALARRASEGGSWLVRVALARTGKWITDGGLLDAAAVADIPANPPRAELARLLMETAAPEGVIRHLAPVVRLSETAPRWVRAPVPLGFHPPQWPDH